jgi:hypothetical protein
MDDFDVPVPQAVRVHDYSKVVRRLKTRILELERELNVAKAEHQAAVSLLACWELQAGTNFTLLE